MIEFLFGFSQGQGPILLGYLDCSGGENVPY